MQTTGTKNLPMQQITNHQKLQNSKIGEGDKNLISKYEGYDQR